mmetsp:Transcript_19387/g.34540  ORF Transcript_19387/g.34540 Transcript_19387/m.34540 type:complete len:1141 (+) Transcript_19387:140-3562(+)
MKGAAVKCGVVVGVAAIVATRALDSCSGTSVVELDQYNSRCSQDTSIQSESASFSSCCGRVSDSDEFRRLLGNKNVATQAAASDETCRIVEASSPFCDEDNGDDCSDIGARDLLTINLAVESVAQEESCCATCTCFGDPECVAFDGTRDAWVLCDARKNGKCTQKKKACLNDKDHMKNQCVWLKDTDEWNDFNDGSPCQPDFAKSGYAPMNMYKADDFSLDLELGERGVIVSAQITSDDGIFKLEADRCFEYDPRDDSKNPRKAWEKIQGKMPSDWSYTTDNAVEIKWFTKDPTTGIFVTIVCTRSFANNEPGAARLNIESVTETVPERAGASGFCATGSIEKTGSARKRRKEYKNHQFCASKNIPGLLVACKALIDEGCNLWNVDSHLTNWCNSADLSHTRYGGDSSSCVDSLMSLKGNKKRSALLTEVVCEANELESFECVSEITQFGWETFLTAHSNGIIDTSDTSSLNTCATSVSEYGTSDGECAQGIRVEYLDDNEWKEAFFIPNNFPPCGEELLIAGDEFPELFTHKIRLAQCGLSSECLTENECKPTPGFTSSITFDSPPCAQAVGCLVCSKENNLPQKLCGSNPDTATTDGSCDECCVQDALLEDSNEELCRELSSLDAFCDPDSDGDLCDNLEQYDTELELHLTFEETTTTSCCQQCSCWGDPLCNSFDDVLSKWILCDSRAQGNCKLSEDVCLTQKDHKGNECKWNTDIAKKVKAKRSDVALYGSPCQADWEQSGTASMLMYKVEGTSTTAGLEVNLEMGERGVIETVEFIKDGVDTFRLEAGICRSATAKFPEKGFNIHLDNDSSPMTPTKGTLSGRNINVEVTDGPGEDETTVALSFADVGVHVHVVCIEVIEDGKVMKARQNVPNLIDTKDRADGTQSGTCFNSEIDTQDATTDVTELVYADCAEGLDEIHLMCKAVAEQSCTASEVPHFIEQWCETANVYPGQTDRVTKCIADINPSRSDTDAIFYDWSAVYCHAVENNRPEGQAAADFHRICLSDIANEGITATAAKYGTGSMLDDASAVCGSSASDYASVVNSCETGVSVETLNPDNGEWEVELFIPARKPPCDGVLRVQPETHPLMFARTIRYRQCNVDLAECSIDVGCLPMNGFDGKFLFTYNDAMCNSVQP